jgi:predicted Abi (CAAX) family protease
MISSSNEINLLVKSRLVNAVLSFPNSSDCFWSFILLLIFSSIVIPLGFSLDFLKFEVPKISWKVLLRVLLMTLFFPAAAEEAIFRVLLLPHKVEQASLATKCFLGSISLILFIVYHPLSARFFARNAQSTFNSFTFLTLAAILGAVCTVSYLQSGSIYPPMILHWILVLGWLLCLGGYRRLNS